MPTNEFLAVRGRAGARILLLLSIAVASTTVAAQSASISSSVQTVDELLRQENLQLLERKGGATAAGPAAGKPQRRKLDLHVRAIYGVGRLQADLLANGHVIEGVPAGATIDQCKITAIQNRCVLMEPAPQRAKKGDGVDAAQSGSVTCPARTCWAALDQQPVVAAATAPAGPGQMPAGVPGPAPSAAVQK